MDIGLPGLSVKVSITSLPNIPAVTITQMLVLPPSFTLAVGFMKPIVTPERGREGVLAKATYTNPSVEARKLRVFAALLGLM